MKNLRNIRNKPTSAIYCYTAGFCSTTSIRTGILCSDIFSFAALVMWSLLSFLHLQWWWLIFWQLPMTGRPLVPLPLLCWWPVLCHWSLFCIYFLPVMTNSALLFSSLPIAHAHLTSALQAILLLLDSALVHCILMVAFAHLLYCWHLLLCWHQLWCPLLCW